MDGQSQRVKKSSFDQFRKNKFLLTQKGMRKENFMKCWEDFKRTFQMEEFTGFKLHRKRNESKKVKFKIENN